MKERRERRGKLDQGHQGDNGTADAPDARPKYQWHTPLHRLLRLSVKKSVMTLMMTSPRRRLSYNVQLPSLRE
eukprot:2730825-Amphidinium_carterae.1